jgi:hypothetical protein
MTHATSIAEVSIQHSLRMLRNGEKGGKRTGDQASNKVLR